MSSIATMKAVATDAYAPLFAFVTDDVIEVPGCEWLSVASIASRQLFVGNEKGSAPALYVARNDCAIVLTGSLFNRKDIESDLGSSRNFASDSELIHAGYERWGEGLFARLRGVFSLIVWDRARDTIFALRDPLGTSPLFYAEVGRHVLFSTSMEMLLRHPSVSRDLNRGALADFFLDRFPRLDETFFGSVKRVPPGHVFSVALNRRSSHRYWDPAPNGSVDWLSADEVDQFDEVFDQAVSRCLSLGPSAIFLSGGLDSVSVAAAALDRSQAGGLPKPLALSLVFPQPDINEEKVQRSVALQLGLPHVLKPFYDAVGKKQLLDPALEMTKTLPSPLMNTWLPAYSGLAAEAKRQGFDTILTGNGGDEWLTIGPYLAADLLRSFKVSSIFRLGQNMRRSHGRSSLTIMRALLCRFGAQPLLMPPLHRLLKRWAPWSIRLKHAMFPELPDWLAPDLTLRRELKSRREEYAINKAVQSDHSFYINEARKALDHPLISSEMEEYFNVYQRLGLRLLHPFWDADLVNLLFRTPPFMLDRGGRNKGLVRSCLQRKFPNLGFERQVKLEATNFYSTSIRNEAQAIWQKLDATNTLAKLGIVDKKQLGQRMDSFFAGSARGLYPHIVWSVLNLEAWSRSHVS